MKFYHLDRTQILRLPLAETFAFFANPRHLEAITPGFVHFKFLHEPPLSLQAGSLIDYRIRLLGVPIRWQSMIEVWEPPRCFVDAQVKGPYAHWRHSHLFEEAGERRTQVRDHIEFALPLGPLGRVAYRLFVARTLKRIFDFRAERLPELLRPAWDD